MRVIKPCISDEIMNKSEIISSAQKIRDHSLSLSISLSLSLSFPRNTMATSKSDRRFKKSAASEPDSALGHAIDQKKQLVLFDKKNTGISELEQI